MSEENKHAIPEKGGPLNTKTYVAGNYTSTIPKKYRDHGILVNKNKNFSGKEKPQFAVMENDPVQVDSCSIKVDLKCSTFSQATENHDALSHTPISIGSSLSKKLKNKLNNEK